MKRYFRTAIKAAISIGLLSYLVYEAEPGKIWQVLSQILANQGLVFLLAAISLQLLSVFLMSVRWKILLAGYGHHPPISGLFSYYLIGMFFNNFLPTSIGGDVIRIYKVIEEVQDRTAGFAGVIIERIMGIAATLFMAIIALYFISSQYQSRRIFYGSVGLFLLIMMFFFLMTRNRPFKLLIGLFEQFTFFQIGEKFNKLFEAIHYFRHRRRIFLYTFLLSLLSQSLIVLMNFFLAQAFNLPVSLTYLFMVVPVTIILTMLPSINGVGVRDGGFVILLAKVGITHAQALTLSFMNLLIPLFVSLSGAVLFISQKKKLKMEKIDVLESSF